VFGVRAASFAGMPDDMAVAPTKDAACNLMFAPFFADPLTRTTGRCAALLPPQPWRA